MFQISSFLKFNIGVGFLATLNTLAIDVGHLLKTSVLTASSSGHSKITCWTVMGASLHHLHRGRRLWISVKEKRVSGWSVTKPESI